MVENLGLALPPPLRAPIILGHASHFFPSPPNQSRGLSSSSCPPLGPGAQSLSSWTNLSDADSHWSRLPHAAQLDNTWGGGGEGVQLPAGLTSEPHFCSHLAPALVNNSRANLAHHGNAALWPQTPPTLCHCIMKSHQALR